MMIDGGKIRDNYEIGVYEWRRRTGIRSVSGRVVLQKEEEGHFC